jgi:hypothetical protein
MQITANTTGMLADLAVVADPDAVDHCVVAIKGTFVTDQNGRLTLADHQQPLTTVDEHYGEPGSSCVRYECDFALYKPYTDVIVVGKAVAPNGIPVTGLSVRLLVQGRAKDILVYGQRHWVSTLAGVRVSEPEPFTEMPITFDRAFGGQDDTQGKDRVAVELRNPVGVGFQPHRHRADLTGWPVPNIESPGRAIDSPREPYEPAGYGCIGRSWQPRVALAGTYGESWRNERAPYLPADFDPRYFQCAPQDQQFPHFQGGEKIRCVHMAAHEVVEYTIPTLNMPVRFRFRDVDVERKAVLDTVIVEPHRLRAMLVWRASVPLRKKLTALTEVQVGEPPQTQTVRPIGARHGKPVFSRLALAVRYLRQQRGGRA